MNLNNQNGFTIVQAIFILVVLALLGTYMVKLSTLQQSTTTQALLQARAYQAARAGLEWGIAKIVNEPNHAAALNMCNNIGRTGNTSGPQKSEFGVDGHLLTVTCENPQSYNEGNNEVGVYTVKAVATYAEIFSPDYVSRTLEVTIHD